MRDLVCSWYAQQSESVWVVLLRRQIREEPKKVFSVQLLPVKGTCDVDSSLDVGREEGGID